MALQKNPKHGTWKLPEGYQDLGWINHGRIIEIIQCKDKGHRRTEFDNSLYLRRCTDVISICDKCKNVFHTDMSD